MRNQRSIKNERKIKNQMEKQSDILLHALLLPGKTKVFFYRKVLEK